MAEEQHAAIEAEFDALTTRQGIEVPADLKGGVLHGYAGLREMTALLRGVDTGRHSRTDSSPHGRTADQRETAGG